MWRVRRFTSRGRPSVGDLVRTGLTYASLVPSVWAGVAAGVVNGSMREAITVCEELAGRPMQWSYSDSNRAGDHIWWISDVRKFESHYPEWELTYDIRRILAEIHTGLEARTGA